MKQTILITGGAGYIGSHANKLLSESGYNTIVVDNLSTGHKEFVKWGKFYQGDFSDRDLLTKICTQHSIDAVMHFAAKSIVSESINNPKQYYHNNVEKTEILLDEMKKHNITNFIFSSSCAIYSSKATIPIDEENDFNPINPYGETKVAIENVLAEMNSNNQVHYCSLRYFNAAGADFEGKIGEKHIPESHVIPLLLSAINKNQLFKIFGDNYSTPDGTCIRDYIHVNDIAQAHLLALKFLFNGGESTAFNLGNGEGISVKELITIAEKKLKREATIQIDPKRAGDQAILISDSTKANRILGWKPEYDIEAIINSAWKWYKLIS